jgi:hypothetical protein
LSNAVKKALDAVRNALKTHRDDPLTVRFLGRNPVLNDFSATLLVAVVIPLVSGRDGEDATAGQSGEAFVITFQIGDGAIASIDADAGFDAALHLLGSPQSGRFAGETEFLTSMKNPSDDAYDSRMTIRRGRLTHVLLMSDGVSDDFFPNNPGLLELYLNLEMNGILKTAAAADAAGGFRGQLPPPVSYPWVNDGDVSFALQYARNVLGATGLSLPGLWERNDIRRASALENFGVRHGDKSEDRLSVWLDNYSMRGSFDDRSLVIIEILR